MKKTTKVNMSQSLDKSQEISHKYFENQQMELSSPVDPSKPPKPQLETNLIPIHKGGKVKCGLFSGLEPTIHQKKYMTKNHSYS